MIRLRLYKAFYVLRDSRSHIKYTIQSPHTEFLLPDVFKHFWTALCIMLTENDFGVSGGSLCEAIRHHWPCTGPQQLQFAASHPYSLHVYILFNSRSYTLSSILIIPSPVHGNTNAPLPYLYPPNTDKAAYWHACLWYPIMPYRYRHRIKYIGRCANKNLHIGRIARYPRFQSIFRPIRNGFWDISLNAMPRHMHR